MYAQYIITLPPSRRRRRRWFTGASERETYGQGRRYLAAAAILAFGLPAAWALVNALPSMSDDSEAVLAMTLPELPAPPAVSEEMMAALLPPLPHAEKPAMGTVVAKAAPGGCG